MDKVVTIAFLTTGFYSVFKFLELRLLDKPNEFKALKYFIRDTLFVFFASLVASLLYFQIQPALSDLMNVITETKTMFPNKTEIFTGDPGF